MSYIEFYFANKMRLSTVGRFWVKACRQAAVIGDEIIISLHIMGSYDLSHLMQYSTRTATVQVYFVHVVLMSRGMKTAPPPPGDGSMKKPFEKNDEDKRGKMGKKKKFS